MKLSNRFAIAVVAALVAMVAPHKASAQVVEMSDRLLTPGARVRLTLSREEVRERGIDRVSGALVAASQQRVIVTRPGQTVSDTVPTFTIDQFDVYAGKRSRIKMVVAGAAAGALVSGAVFGLDKVSRGQRCGKRTDCRFLSPASYLIPIGVGALFGSTFSSARWVTIPRDAIAFGPSGGRGLAVSSTVHFR